MRTQYWSLKNCKNKISVITIYSEYCVGLWVVYVILINTMLINFPQIDFIKYTYLFVYYFVLPHNVINSKKIMCVFYVICFYWNIFFCNKLHIIILVNHTQWTTFIDIIFHDGIWKNYFIKLNTFKKESRNHKFEMKSPKTSNIKKIINICFSVENIFTKYMPWIIKTT